MSLLFDALGHWALTHPPDSNITSLALNTGVFTLSGKTMLFEIDQIDAVGVFTLSGKSMVFEIDGRIGVGTFVFSGSSMGLNVNLKLGKGGFILTGYDLTFSFDRAFTFKRFITECHGGKVYTTRVEEIKHT